MALRGPDEHASSLPELLAQRSGVASVEAVAAVEGISVRGVRKRIERRELVELLPGVVAAHRVVSRRGWWHAAQLWCPTRCALGWFSGGAVLDLTADRSSVTLLAEGQPRSRDPVRVRRTERLHPRDVHVLEGLTVCTAELLVVQLAPLLSDRSLSDLVHRADERHLLDDRRIAATLARHPTAKGIARARAALGASELGAHLNGSLEVAMPPVLRLAAVPAPAFNALVLDFVVDLFWPAVGLVIELDGFEEHGRKRRAFREDRRRDRALRAAGFDHERMTWDAVVPDPASAAAEIRALHAASAVTVAVRAAHFPQVRAAAGL